MSVDIWKVLEIEETVDGHKIKRAYEKMIDKTPMEATVQLRKISQAYEIASEYRQEIVKKLGRPYDSPTYATDKATFDKNFYGQIHRKYRTIDEDEVVIKKLIIDLKVMYKEDELTVENMEKFVLQLTRERIIRNPHSNLLFTELMNFLTKYFENLSLSYPFKTKAITDQIKHLHEISGSRYEERINDLDYFWEWLEKFDLRLKKAYQDYLYFSRTGRNRDEDDEKYGYPRELTAEQVQRIKNQEEKSKRNGNQSNDVKNSASEMSFKRNEFTNTEKLELLHQELMRKGRYNSWIVGMRNKSYKHDVFCLDYVDQKWKIYYTERGRDASADLETNDLDEAINFYREKILASDYSHCIVFTKTQNKIDEYKYILDKNGISSIQNDMTYYHEEEETAFRLFVLNEDVFKAERLFGTLPYQDFYNRYQIEKSSQPVEQTMPSQPVEQIISVIPIENAKKKLRNGQVPTVTFRGNLHGVGKSYVEINEKLYIASGKVIRAFKPQPYNTKKVVENIAKYAYEVIVEFRWYEKTWEQNPYFQLEEADLQEVERRLKRKSAINMAIVLIPLIILIMLILIDIS